MPEIDSQIRKFYSRENLPGQIGRAFEDVGVMFLIARMLAESTPGNGTAPFIPDKLDGIQDFTTRLLPKAERSYALAAPRFEHSFRLRREKAEDSIDSYYGRSCHEIALAFSRAVASRVTVDGPDFQLRPVSKPLDRWRLICFSLLWVKPIDGWLLEGLLLREARLTAALPSTLSQMDPRSVQTLVKPLGGKARKTASISKEASALAALFQSPNMSIGEIAEAAGCRRQSLYRMPKFQQALASLRASREGMPKGSRSDEGRMEAWDGDEK